MFKHDFVNVNVPFVDTYFHSELTNKNYLMTNSADSPLVSDTLGELFDD